MQTDPPSGQLASILRRHLPSLADDAPIERDVLLKNYGLDSMQAVNLVFAIEDEMGIVIPDSALTGETFETFHNLHDMVEGARAGRADAR
jgi:acyl carrier protein